ncbi:MAG: ArgR family transcriptional regulator [Paludibacteraceae bacterium]|nr:ArgR family transcriptional regulator [Paludibacteraceae bacterium]
MNITPKANRQKLITVILQTQEISNQQQMLDALLRCGVEATQGTVSRDLEELGVVKQPTATGKMKYTVPQEAPLVEPQEAPSKDFFQTNMLSLDFCGVFGVIKTRNGYAAVMAQELQKCLQEWILGTIPGVDTILVIPKDGVSKEKIAELVYDLRVGEYN